MKKISPNNLAFYIFEKWPKEIKYIFKVIYLLLVVAYIGYFVKTGFDFTQTRTHDPIETILLGVLFTALLIISLFVFHFSGGTDFDIRWVIFFIGLAVGGALVGLIAGLIKGVLGWIIGGLIGVIAIYLSFKFYSKYLKK